MLIGITAVFLLSMPVAAIFVPWMFATSLANKHLAPRPDAQRVASTVLKEWKVLSEPVLEAADDSKLQGVPESDGVQRLLKYVKSEAKRIYPCRGPGIAAAAQGRRLTMFAGLCQRAPLPPECKIKRQ